ncbi:MAG: YeeE/YedE family protein [Moraxellaceae bacterium]|nr:YeeE/YedE family protein [Pseudobdellovibrionaceae bacterium]
MKNNVVALIVGILFAIGLGVSGMTKPEKVFGFLDIFGKWDASLIFVMLGAILVHLIAYRFIIRLKSPLFSKLWHLPTKKEITWSLILGSFIFGVGWALAGYCPGPALTSLASFQMRPLLFFVSLIFGMLTFRLIDRKLNLKR